METLDLPRLEQGGRLTELNICFDGSRYSMFYVGQSRNWGNWAAWKFRVSLTLFVFKI